MNARSFWNDLLPHVDDGIKFQNVTVDVVRKGCFKSDFNIVACARDGTLAALILVTSLLCVKRVIRLHVVRDLQIHQYVIFYCASIECILLTVDCLIGKTYPQLEFVALFLQLLQFVFLCHFHCALVTRILRLEKLVFWVVIPVLTFCCLCSTPITILGIISPKSTWTECLEPQWLLLSSIEFFIMQLFMIAGIYITQNINSVSSLNSFKNQQKVELWSIIVAYETSAIVSLCRDIIYNIVGNKQTGCSGIYDDQQIFYSAVLALYTILDYLLPIWVLVIFYRPSRGYLSSDEERLLGYSGDGMTRSTFSTTSSRSPRTYEQSHPSFYERTISPYSSLRRCQSSPASISSSRRSHHSIFAPISEECPNQSTRSSQVVHGNINRHLGESSTDFHHNFDFSGEQDKLVTKIISS